MAEPAQTRGISPSAPDGPPVSVLVREKQRSYLCNFPYSANLHPPEGSVSFPEARVDAVWASDGTKFATIEGQEGAAVVRRAGDAKQVLRFGGEGCEACDLRVSMVAWSPKGTFLLSWARPDARFKGENLVVWDASTGKKVAGWLHKTFHIAYWPFIQWSDDESVAARMVTNTVHFYDGNHIRSDAAPVAKLGIPGLSKFMLSKGPAPYKVAAFIPSTKGGGPGRITLYQHPDQGGTVIAQRSTFRADSVNLLWNSRGTAVLAMTSTNTDATGKSYYGESEIHFMSADGSVQERVNLPKEGPTFDAAWSPSGTEFIVIYGYMPSRATMFNSKCEPVFDFGSGQGRNTVSFSPHGRFVALAGFGNLAGHVEFWDKNEMIRVGECQLPCTTTYCWSPCSRYFLGATTFPRLRVDNQLTVVRFDGTVIQEQRIEEGNYLYQATFRPALGRVYADPKLLVASGHVLGGPLRISITGKTAGKPVTTESRKKGVYRPPGMQGTAPSFSLHSRLAAGKVEKGTFMSRAVETGSSNVTVNRRKKYIPGLNLEEQEKKPNKRRPKKKEKQKETSTKETSTKETAAATGPASLEELTPDMIQRKIKATKKKLRQVAALKQGQADGKELNDDQIKKIKGESNWLQELEALEAKLKGMGT